MPCGKPTHSPWPSPQDGVQPAHKGSAPSTYMTEASSVAAGSAFSLPQGQERSFPRSPPPPLASPGKSPSISASQEHLLWASPWVGPTCFSQLSCQVSGLDHHPHLTGGETEAEVITRPVSELKAASELLASKTASPRPSLTAWERRSRWIGRSIASLGREPFSLMGARPLVGRATLEMLVPCVPVNPLESGLC